VSTSWIGRRRLLISFPILLLIGLAIFSGVRESIDNRLERRPLEAAQTAAEQSGQTIKTVSPARADRWSDGNGPPLTTAEAYVGSGNHLLEPAFYSLSAEHGHETPPPRGSECVFLATQPGAGEFDARAVTTVLRICYAVGASKPLAWSQVATDQ